MNTRALNSLADVICRAQNNGKRTPMGIAFAIDSAGRHMTPETAAELERLRARVAELERQVRQAKAAGDLLGAALVDRALEELGVAPAPVEVSSPVPVVHRCMSHDLPDRVCGLAGPHGAHVAEAGLSSEWLCHGRPAEAGGASC
jgi:hypothetical protein